MTATDIDESRLKLIRENIQRLKSEVRVIARGEVGGLERQDLVWVDAPCTGKRDDLPPPGCPLAQARNNIGSLVGTAAEAGPGGLGAGSSRRGSGCDPVCSVFDEEGPAVIYEAILKGHIRKTWALAPHQAPYGTSLGGLAREIVRFQVDWDD